MSDKVFLITGASTGIGAQTARAAAKAGYKLALAARSVGKLAALVDELGGRSNALAISCDVTSVDDQKRMVSETLAAFGRIDAAFANAGIGATTAGTEYGDPGNWRDMILTNVFGCAVTAKVVLPELKKTRGHILLTGSRAGRDTLKGSIYGATKWAVRGFAENLRAECAGTGVRVTLIAPGMVDTPFFDTPKPKALKAGDVANAVMYALLQPAHVNVADVLVLPVPQAED